MENEVGEQTQAQVLKSRLQCSPGRCRNVAMHRLEKRGSEWKT